MAKIDETPMGYMYISESVDPEFKPQIMNIQESVNETQGVTIFTVDFDTVLQDFDVKNRNQRYYDGDNVWSCIQSDKIQSLLRTGGWFGEFDHPTPETVGEKLSPERIQNVPPERRAFKIMNPRRIGNTLQASIQSAQTDIGIGFGKEILAGWQAQFSARAIANMIMKNYKPYVQVKKLITYDAPWYPSHEAAHMIGSPKVTMKTFTESVETALESAKEMINGVIIPLKDILVDIGIKDVNTNIILESFDLGLDNLAGFDVDRKHVIIKDENNVIYADINPESAKRVNDFFTSF